MGKADNQVATLDESKIDPFTGKPDIERLDFADLMALLDQGEVIHLSELDDTTQIDKKDLVGVPFMIVRWDQKSSGLGDYVVVRAITADNQRMVFADGSTGIKDQLIKFGVDKPILCPKGLRVSNYIYQPEGGGDPVSASTYYLDTAR